MRIIELKNIKKQYNQKIIFQNINYSFMDGKCYMLVGENGIGKSTLIKIILNLVKQDEGEVIINDSSFGYVPEKYTLAEYMTIIDFLLMMGLLRGMNKDKLLKEIDKLLFFWGMNNDGNKKMRELSKGMLQKVVLMQAMLHDPNVYIFDEALNGLDPIMQDKLLAFINEEKKKGKLIIITSHYPKLYANTVDVVISFKNGNIISNEFN